jgi:hypothetical protein
MSLRFVLICALKAHPWPFTRKGVTNGELQ